MAAIGIMIEGQEGLNWQRWLRLAEAVEQLGFESLFRSDHLTALNGFHQREALELWTSLAVLATRTTRLRFGPLVASLTFAPPALLAKKAIALDQLSGGRFELGIGAGWYTAEHRMFGIPYPPYQTRLDMLDEGARVIKALCTGQPATFTGARYSLLNAETHPGPIQNPFPLIIGGKNEQRTLRIVAEHATEWNCAYFSPQAVEQKSRVLDAHCEKIGRDPRSLRRSVMLPYVIAKDVGALRTHVAAHHAMTPQWIPATWEAWQAAGFIGGSPQQVVDQIKAFEAVGVQRFMLQHNRLDDFDSLELMASEVLPHVQ